MKNKKVILAFSGGLDTTFCAVHLAKQGWEVHALTVNTGGFSETELDKLREHAEKLGVASFTVMDQLLPFYERVIRYLIYGNVLKNDSYPLSVSAERIAQAQAVTEFAKKKGAAAIAHGSTGAGNDQVRFDMLIRILSPETLILTPIRDLKISRDQEVAFLKQQGVKMNFDKAAYSINKGIWGTSVGGKETLNSLQPLPDRAFPDPVVKSEAQKFILEFDKGQLVAVNAHSFSHPVQAIQFLAEHLKGYGIGRDMHVGDTIIGIKGRVGFEAAAPLMIIKAHHALEKHVLTKWQLYWKDQLASWYGNWLHEGQLLDPVMRNIEAFLEDSQINVTGKVFLTAYPYRFTVDGIASEFDLMSSKFGTYGEMNNSWTGEDVKGFTKIFGNQVEIYHKIKELATHE